MLEIPLRAFGDERKTVRDLLTSRSPGDDVLNSIVNPDHFRFGIPIFGCRLHPDGIQISKQRLLELITKLFVWTNLVSIQCTASEHTDEFVPDKEIALAI